MEIHTPAGCALQYLRPRTSPLMDGTGLHAAQKRLQHPVSHALGTANHLRRHRQLRKREQLINMRSGTLHAVH